MHSIVILTDCEPDDKWAIHMLLRCSYIDELIIVITSPSPEKHLEEMNELVLKTCNHDEEHFNSVEIYAGSKYSRAGMIPPTDPIVYDKLKELFEQSLEECITVFVLTTPYDLMKIFEPKHIQKIEDFYVMGGHREDGSLAFNWRIHPQSAHQLMNIGIPYNKLRLFTTEFYRKTFGASINFKTCPKFIQLFFDEILRGEDLAMYPLYKSMVEFDKRNAEKNPEVRKLIPVGQEGKQLCPADVFVMSAFLSPLSTAVSFKPSYVQVILTKGDNHNPDASATAALNTNNCVVIEHIKWAAVEELLCMSIGVGNYS